MGFLEDVAGVVNAQISQRGLGVVLAAGFASFIVLAVVLNVLNQILFKNPNEPPIVFHWLPIIGNTITYGMDPYAFFFQCKEKVCTRRDLSITWN
jgi:sterol 14-demethylase